VLCCMDYGLRHVVGNLLKQDYYEMFSQLGELHSANMRCGDQSTLCKTCSRATRWLPNPTYRQHWDNLGTGAAS